MVDLLQKNIGHKITLLPPAVAEGAGKFGGDSALLNSDVEKIAKIMNLPFEETLRLTLISWQASLLSLEEKIRSSLDDTAPLFEVLPNSLLGEQREDNWDPAISAEIKILGENVFGILEKTLTPKEIKIISLRYGLKDGIERTLDEVGRMFPGKNSKKGLSRERVRQIESRAFGKIRTALDNLRQP
jgi:RNA polymerase primary sigma factor